ncbi:MAG: hypothetical protein FWH37_00180 [Candidatus Bathyarchaeota archaeon]|nr:hypothetical protein [Candidatus Termiticorpusculum sp.]
MTTKDSKKLSEKNLSVKTETIETQACPKCSSIRKIHDPEYAETICMDCGFVIQQTIIEKKSNTKQKLKHQTANNTPLTYTIHNKESKTVIDWHTKDNYEKNPVIQKTHMYKLRKWHRRIKITNASDHDLVFALSEIAKMSNKLNLPKNVLETASTIYQEAIKEHLTRGHSIQSLAAATLYLTCKQYKLSKTLNEVTKVSKVDKKELGKSYIYLIKNLNYLNHNFDQHSA